ncbi:AarF/ABC1/UbiB kinase family protein [Planktothrix agardhii 1806]|jgi:predicted unusual protein kinase regulating ubiquinone biosynthesis (AarF/ABC1/UbiB family)|uniref:Protein kinase domain-containing protein n=1 Tax=Planktothrix agardhii (strain NIVA-CYA 126/8) TaxID=388467 RepID=A0A073CXP7_PLAA1|nr:AarF/ABC1/UbiB kinase family protein [Planktothrix agardhii]MCB8758373.1 AarF/ABC1/UbiB kinase family protein [Planktothrix agardhii 1813]MCB8765892.1 AarF/ABC1/UbiB kinase family protein [Planktothrix agardhii 1809]MCB8779528.1 AarF/ABC1/UbiB kinase family protein [Planktothrix agardhii 1031]MCB8787939.1 AarF/ABC1/UbiB kinase family protein [Planktothrix agardhii 1025]MCF3565033.1 AarF/ABC1/UbiB kinase family protein [Planktothrix agardhii 1807]MCF3572356.1 AarF/ABC1/UbiB kinase family pr
MTITQLEPNGSFSPATIDVSSKSMDEHHPRPEGTIHKESDQPTVRYDPVAIADYYRSRLFQVWGRLFRIIWKFGSFALGLWFDGKRGKKVKTERKRAIQLRTILTEFGPAFIKVGQALSTRPDVMPTLYLDELTKLQDQLPPFSNEVAYQFIEEELGDHPDNIYAELSADPLAAASLGQVYKGKLKTGETVAVKVQRPGLSESIALDIYILRTLAQFAKKRFKFIRSDLVAIMDEFGERIYEEMDYNHEGRNAERFKQLYGNIPDIYVPRIYWGYTGRRVLTMEWINGTKLTNLEEVTARGIDARYLIEVGVQCSLRQLLEHGFFHADPHPGNLLASPEGKLVYLDFGMMSEVKPYQRYGLLEAIVHLVNRDFEGLAKDYVKLEFLKPETDLTPIIPALAEVFSNALGASVAELNFKSITDQLSELMYEYPFQVPAYYALIIRSLVTLEGIAINVDPNFKVLSKAYPYVAKRLLTDPSVELRTSLKDLLFKDGSFRWNRLENLLKNAQNSEDYDINQMLDQTLDFLFSERGELIREQLGNELVKGIDTVSRNALTTAQSKVAEWMGVKVSPTPTTAPQTTPNQNNLEQIQRIVGILQDTKGFDPMLLVQRVPGLMVKPEVQNLSQKVAGELAQRAAARLIRELFLSSDPLIYEDNQLGSTVEKNGDSSQGKSLPKQPLSLPPSR